MPENFEELQAECEELLRIAHDHKRISYTFALTSPGGAPDAPLRIQTPLYLGVSAEGMAAFSEVVSCYSREELERILSVVEVHRESAKREGQSILYAHWNNITTVVIHALAEILGRSGE